MDQLQTCLLFGDNNKRVWHITDQTLENKSVNSFNRYNLMKNLTTYQSQKVLYRFFPKNELFTQVIPLGDILACILISKQCYDYFVTKYHIQKSAIFLSCKCYKPEGTIYRYTPAKRYYIPDNTFWPNIICC